MHRRSALHALLIGGVALALAGGAGASPARPYAEVDANARTELEGVAPAALAAWDAANGARDDERYTDAEAGYRAVTNAAPKFDHGHRRLCSSLSALRRADEAIIECRTAMSLRESPENEAALAAALVDAPAPPPAALAEARGLVLHAQKTRPDDLAITAVAARVAMARGDGSSFEESVATLHRIAPDAEETVFFSILQDLDHEDVDGARAELAAHRSLFRPERAAGLDAMIDDVASHPTPMRTAGRVAKVLAVLACVVLVAALVRRRTKDEPA